MSTVEAVQLDEAKLEAFMGKVLEDLSGTMTTFFCSIGDRLGLFRNLAELTGYRGEPAFAALPKGEVRRSVLDNELAERELGWKPWTHLEDGLAETVSGLREV